MYKLQIDYNPGKKMLINSMYRVYPNVIIENLVYCNNYWSCLMVQFISNFIYAFKQLFCLVSM